jgi:hypothetical protein
LSAPSLTSAFGGIGLRTQFFDCIGYRFLWAKACQRYFASDGFEFSAQFLVFEREAY